jgi:hypothetical protein
MNKILSALLTASLILPGCGSRSWFGPDDAPPTDDLTVVQPTNPLIPPERTGLFERPDPADSSVLIDRVTKLQIDQTPSGAIILAEGIAGRQGAFNARLKPTADGFTSEDGILKLEFRVSYPVYDTPLGPERSREVTEALTLSRQELARINQIIVTGSQNSMQSRRR